MSYQKGNSLLIIPKDYTVIDFETTGLDFYFCKIIEIGALKVRNGQIVQEFQTFINPKCSISDFIASLTGITNEMVADAPHLEDIAPKFIEFVNDDIIVGHNVTFDINFFISGTNKSLLNDFVDTLRLSKRFFTDYENHKLTTVANNLGIERSKEHRSLDDCYTCKSVLDKISQYVQENTINLDTYFKKSSSYSKYNKVNANNITTDNIEFDEENFLFNKNCVFTGTLEKITRKDAMQIVVDLGGHCLNGLTKEANILIMGNNDYCPLIKDGKSSKQKKAEEYILKGQDLIIITESTFYDLIS